MQLINLPNNTVLALGGVYTSFSHSAGVTTHSYIGASNTLRADPISDPGAVWFTKLQAAATTL